jgi:hypothetical protein
VQQLKEVRGMEDVLEQFGFSKDLSDAEIQAKLREKEEAIRRDIRKQMKLKEGAEKLHRAATDRKSAGDAQAIIKQAGSRLIELNDELQDVSAYLIMANGVAPRGWLEFDADFIYLKSLTYS